MAAPRVDRVLLGATARTLRHGAASVLSSWLQSAQAGAATLWMVRLACPKQAIATGKYVAISPGRKYYGQLDCTAVLHRADHRAGPSKLAAGNAARRSSR